MQDEIMRGHTRKLIQIAFRPSLIDNKVKQETPASSSVPSPNLIKGRAPPPETRVGCRQLLQIFAVVQATHLL